MSNELSRDRIPQEESAVRTPLTEAPPQFADMNRIASHGVADLSKTQWE
jgi:hypothetical protein